MGTQTNPRIPSRTSNNKKTTTTIPANKTPTVTLLNPNGTFNDSIFDLDEILAQNQRQAEAEAAEAQRKMEEEQKNSITFFKTPSNEDFEKLMDCYKNLPHTLKNIEVKNMRSSIEIDLDDEDWEELELDADFEGVTIEPKSGGSDKIIISLPMQEDFVKAINANTETLKEKYETLKSRYIGTDENGNEIIIKPFDKDYETEYNKIVTEEHEFLFGENSIIDMFNGTKEDVIDELVKKNPKDKEIKNDFKKLKKNLKIEVNFSDPIKVVTSIDYDANGIITKVHRKSINTKMTLTLKYPKKSGGTPKKIYSETFNLLDN